MNGLLPNVTIKSKVGQEIHIVKS